MNRETGKRRNGEGEPVRKWESGRMENENREIGRRENDSWDGVD